MYFIYDIETGEIIRSVKCPEHLVSLQCRNGQSFIEGEEGDDQSHYVLNGAITSRPEFEITVEGNVIKGVPADIQVIIEGVSYQSDGDDIEVHTEHSGTYQIDFIGFPFKPTTIEVTTS